MGEQLNNIFIILVIINLICVVFGMITLTFIISNWKGNKKWNTSKYQYLI